MHTTYSPTMPELTAGDPVLRIHTSTTYESGTAQFNVACMAGGFSELIEVEHPALFGSLEAPYDIVTRSPALINSRHGEKYFRFGDLAENRMRVINPVILPGQEQGDIADDDRENRLRIFKDSLFELMLDRQYTADEQTDHAATLFGNVAIEAAFQYFDACAQKSSFEREHATRLLTVARATLWAADLEAPDVTNLEAPARGNR